MKKIKGYAIKIKVLLLGVSGTWLVVLVGRQNTGTLVNGYPLKLRHVKGGVQRCANGVIGLTSLSFAQAVQLSCEEANEHVRAQHSNRGLLSMADATVRQYKTGPIFFDKIKYMAELEELKNEVSLIKERNKKVEVDKAWETSWGRRFLLIIFTYLAIGIYLRAIAIARPWLNAIVPAVAFLLSTLTLPFFKKIWVRYIYKK